MNLVVSWVALTIAFWAASALVPGVKIEGGIRSHLFVAAILGTLTWLLSDALFVALGIATLGLGFLLAFVTRLVVGAVLLLITDKITRRVKVDGFRSAFLASLVIAVVGAGVGQLLHHL